MSSARVLVCVSVLGVLWVGAGCGDDESSGSQPGDGGGGTTGGGQSGSGGSSGSGSQAGQSDGGGGSSGSGAKDAGGTSGSGGTGGSGGSGADAGTDAGTAHDAAPPDSGMETATCGDGVVEGSEACEPANDKCCKDDCSGPLAQGTVCREKDGDCDVEEVCDGSATQCPSDAVAPDTTSCRDAVGACDVADRCDGSSKDCPDDVAPATTVCRPQNGDCDVAEQCDGSGKQCPADAVQPSTYTCRPATGDCDVEDKCDGTSKDCADGVQPETHTCRPKTGDCDIADDCDGTGKDCTADAVQPSTRVCRVAMGDCDVEDTCDGTGKDCADNVQPDTFECRAKNGDCDVADNCDGTGKDCTADAVQPDTFECRAKNGDCDVADRCDGTGKDCGDAIAAATVVCREAATVCDVADHCNATDKTCPADQKVANTTPCDDLDPCTEGDACTGGSCVGPIAHDCGDGNDCTADSCDSADTTGNACRHANLDATACDDSDACTTGDICSDGVCGGTGSLGCNDDNGCTDDACDPLSGCVVSYNTASCEDGNPCTVGDTCFAGSCSQSTPRGCADVNVCTDDSCDPQDLDGDPCAHVDNTATCDDGNSCTTSSQCSNGSCGGSGDACGTGSTGCTPGQPNQCTCDAGQGYVPDGNGHCVPVTDECTLDPCGANTSCSDPSSAPGNAVCTCLPGYQGNPQTGCTNIDECASQPCGEFGTCSENAPGQGYSCTCDDGFVTVNGQCVCDLAGTFVMRIDTTLSWSNIDSVENASNVKLSSWAIRRHAYDLDTGTLTMETVPCGGPTPDICGTGNAFVPGLGPEAYAQFFPNSIWTGNPLLPSQLTEIDDFLDPLPDSAFDTPAQAVLFGISLTNETGAWPASRSGVGTSGPGSTNGARWQDHDGDGQTAVTSYAVPPGGVPANSTPAPPIVYDATSTACPRSNTGPRNSYNYWPYAELVSFIPFNVDLYRVKRFRVASRLISRLDGTIDSCDFISGNVRGAAAGNSLPTPEARVQGCVRCGGFDGSIDCSAASEAPCNAAQIDFFDGQPQTQQTTAATFMIERAADDVTCDQARSFTFHPPAP